MFRIEFSEGAIEDLRSVRVFDRRRVVHDIDEFLSSRPCAVARSRKPLVGLVPPWEGRGLVWELRVGDYRVFYDVDDESALVTVRAVRRKPGHARTEDIL